MLSASKSKPRKKKTNKLRYRNLRCCHETAIPIPLSSFLSCINVTLTINGHFMMKLPLISGPPHHFLLKLYISLACCLIFFFSFSAFLSKSLQRFSMWLSCNTILPSKFVWQIWCGWSLKLCAEYHPNWALWSRILDTFIHSDSTSCGLYFMDPFQERKHSKSGFKPAGLCLYSEKD